MVNPVAISQVSKRLVVVSRESLKVIAVSKITQQIVAIALIPGPAGSSGAFTFNDVPDNITMLDSNAYRADDSLDRAIFSLPVSGLNGGQCRIYGYGLGGWKIIQRLGEQILIEGSQSATTAGIAGYLQSENQYDGVLLTRIATNVYSATTYGCEFN